MYQISVRQSSVLHIPNTGEEIQRFALNTDREMQCPYFEKEKQLDLYLIPAKKSSVFVVVVVLLFVCFNEYRQRNGVCFAPNLEINKECALYRILERKRKSVCFAWIIVKEKQCLVQNLASSVFLTEYYSILLYIQYYRQKESRTHNLYYL